MTSFVSLTVLLFPLSDLPFCLGYYSLLISQELSISYIKVPLTGRNVKFCLAQQFFYKVVFFFATVVTCPIECCPQFHSERKFVS